MVVCICLSFNAFDELFEWWSALALRQWASQFLGTRGDVWDTQWDMFLAPIGATLCLIVPGKAHDKTLAKVTNYSWFHATAE